MTSPTHDHFFTLLYKHGCRACELERFERQLPRGGAKAQLRNFVTESPALTAWDKERLIEKFDL